MRKRSLAVVFAAAALVVAISGCVQTPPQVIPTSESSSKPIFASDAEALAAAKKAFSSYLAVSDAIANDGGRDVGRLRPYDSPDQLKRDSEAFGKMKVAGSHTVGSSSFSDARLESVDEAHDKVVVVAYICMRISGTKLLDSSGNDIGASRPLAVPLEVSFANRKPRSKDLIVDRSAVWSGAAFCS